ncbi:MAG: hypothetical protein WCI11_13330 [Candidatus Methylumidiphilus sp.]
MAKGTRTRLAAPGVHGRVEAGAVAGVDFENLNKLQEVKSMLAKRVIEWTGKATDRHCGGGSFA